MPLAFVAVKHHKRLAAPFVSEFRMIRCCIRTYVFQSFR
jgi:hypothetical protein